MRLETRRICAQWLPSVVLVCVQSAAICPASASWLSLGPFGGGAEIVRTIPHAKNSVLAATRTGLLFLSANGGASWDNLFFPLQTAVTLHALEVDPRSAQVWYAGVEGAIGQNSGIYKTSDAGQSWTLLPDTRGIAVWSMTFWRSNPDVIAAGTDSGVYLTRDAGTHWKLISAVGDPELRPVVSLAFDPRNSDILYAGTTHLPWRTADGGASWQSIHTGMIDDSDVFSIQVDPTQPDRVLASACSGAYSSNDGARHWTRFETPKGAFRTYFTALDPTHPATVFAGTSDGLLKSANDGASWRKVSPHAVKSISFDPFLPGRIFLASTDAGLLVSTDNGDTLREANVGFTSKSFTSLAGGGSMLYLGGLSSLYRSDTLALRWDSLATGADGQMLVVSAAPDQPRSVFGASYHGLFESKDGGKTWQARKNAPPGSRVRALLARPNGILFAGTDLGLYRGEPSGKWDKVATGSFNSIEAFGATTMTAVSNGSALASNDDGKSWRACTAPGAGTTWYGLAVDRDTTSVALAATSAGLYRSTDGCRSWTAPEDGLEQATTEAVLFHPTRANEAFVAQAGRVFRSGDGGRHWQPLDPERRPDLWPSSLLILAAYPDRLFALVPGRGVFSTIASAEPAVSRQASYH